MSRAARWTLFAGFLLAVGFIVAADLWHPFGPRDAWRTFVVRDRAAAAAEDGAWTRLQGWNREALADMGRFEAQIEDESVLRTTVPAWQWIHAVVLHSSGTGRVIFGRDGWFFLRENIELALGRFDAGKRAEADEAVRRLAKRLGEEGLRLLLVPVPSKAEIVPSRFSGRFAAGVALPEDERTKRLFAGWDGLPNVEVLPVRRILREEMEAGRPPFLERDTHWTPQGMEAVASRIAAAAGQAVPDGESDTGADGTEVSGEGDLTRMLELPGNPPFPRQTVRVNRGGDALPSEEPPGIFLLGDSFAAIYGDAILGWGESAGLVDVLGARHGLRIEAFVNHGDPVAGPVGRMIRSLDKGLRPARGMVVWQFAERFLDQGEWSKSLPE